MIKPFDLVFLVCVSSCSHSKLPPPSNIDQNSPNSPARMAGYKAEYASKYAAYRCDRSELPAVQIHPFHENQLKPLVLSRLLKLRLKLGRRIDQPDTYTYRTSSNYILSSSSGKELSRAESMMFKTISGESNAPIKVLFTPFEDCVLVEEETLGAGSMIRHVVFVPAAPQKMGQTSAIWRAFHLDLPERDYGVGEGEHTGTVHGISGGRIFVEMDDMLYAFPLDKFVTTSLGVSNG
jgi:hypothetical protein